MQNIKNQFPIFKSPNAGKPFIYFDNAATAQVPEQVIIRMNQFEISERSNAHSGLHHLSLLSQKAFALARENIAGFINASDPREIIFTKNATESINAIAYAWARHNLKMDDRILVSELEHHSNILPWKVATHEAGAALDWIRVDAQGYLDADHAKTLINDTVKLVALNHVSNALGSINPIEKIITAAKEAGAVTVIDGAQAVPHIPVDVQKLGCDFYAFSGHKLYGPMGIGVLYGRKELLDTMPAFLSGGGTVSAVTKESVNWLDVPERLEGGTQNISGAVGLAEAVAFVREIGFGRIMEHEQDLTTYALDQLQGIDDVIIYGPPANSRRVGVISFGIKGIHPHDVASLLDEAGFAIRAGHHCCGPLMEQLGVAATCRISFGMYNSKDEVDVLIDALGAIIKKFH